MATQVFAEDGYSGARVDEIAERTRTTKRMIYYYFGGKEQLYLAVLEHAYATIREAGSNLPIGDLAPVEALRKLAELTYDHHREHSDFDCTARLDREHPSWRVLSAGSTRCGPCRRQRFPGWTRCWRRAVPPGSSGPTSMR